LPDRIGQLIRLETLGGPDDRQDADEYAGGIADRAACEEAFFQLIVDDRITLLPHLVQFLEEHVPAGKGKRGVRLQLPRQYLRDPVVA